MDFTNRSVPGQQSASGQHQDIEPGSSGSNIKHSGSTSRRPVNPTKWTRVGILVAVLAVVVLIVALIVLVASNNNNTKDTTESSYIKTSKLQAVFLNTGQVYFGNIQTLNNNYLVLSNIFYLQTTSSNGSSSSSSSSGSNSNVTLVKLGCELHRPYDQMVINRSQVTFWENLQSGGQVATAVATYEKDNPGPQKCTDQSTSAGTTTGNSAQGATSNSGTSTNP